MNVLSVASECAPFVKTGGLADVVGALPKALQAHGVSMRTLLPAYPALRPQLQAGRELTSWSDCFGGPGRIVAVESDQVDLLLLDAPHLFDRTGNLYLDHTNSDWFDNHLRFAALSWAGAQIALHSIDGWLPDVVHAHDWQAGLVPAYLVNHSAPTPPVVTTVHNIAFQGSFDASTLPELRIDDALFTPEGVEFFDRVSFLKAGLQLADQITTVSPTYARELMRPEFGMGLEGVLQHRQNNFQGILNGIDLDVWNPGSDTHLIANYNVDTLEEKSRNRVAVAQRFGVEPDANKPLFCVVSRLTEQKGLDVLLECLPTLVNSGASLALLGTGDPTLERGFQIAAEQHPGRVGTIIGYDEGLSHLMQGGSDAILIPSRFEPCGLTQLYGLRYGTLPVVAQTGGLADTVIDANAAAINTDSATGILFSPVNAEALGAAIERTCELFENSAVWTTIMRRAMHHPVGWDQSAAAYARLYQSISGH